jgi:protein SCO1
MSSRSDGADLRLWDNFLMRIRTSWVVVTYAALCVAAAGMWVARETAPSLPRLVSGTWLPLPRSVGPISLIDETGMPFMQARLRGTPSLVYFGFTHCPDVCPTTLVQLARIERSGIVPHLRVIFVTVDPARDRPALLAAYVHAFDPRFIGLTGSQHAIDALARRLGVAYQRIALPGGDYTINHTSVLFLLDASGQIVAIFTGPFDVARLSQDLRRASRYLSADERRTRRS